MCAACVQLLALLFAAACVSSEQQQHLTCDSACCTGQYGDVFVTSDILYGRAANLTNNATVDLYMDMYRARSATGPLPVIIAVHGGGYDVVETKLNVHITNHAATWASRGFLVFSIEYRRHFPWRQQAGIRLIQDPVHDLLAAVRYVRANHESLQADPENIGLQGCSAGAVTAMNANVFEMGEGSSGSSNASSAFNFVISISGGISYTMDLVTFGMFGVQFPPYKDTASMRPVLSIVNERDSIAANRELASRQFLTRSGTAVDLILLPGDAHCPLLSTLHSGGQTIFDAMLAFALNHTGGCRRAGPISAPGSGDGDGDDTAASSAHALVPGLLIAVGGAAAAFLVLRAK